MKVESLKQLKKVLQDVLDSEGFAKFCRECPIERCCNVQKPTCDYVILDKDCKKNKLLNCYFYICPVLNEKNKEVSNWLQRVSSSITWPNKLEFPTEIEDFKE